MIYLNEVIQNSLSKNLQCKFSVFFSVAKNKMFLVKSESVKSIPFQ